MTKLKIGAKVPPGDASGLEDVTDELLERKRMLVVGVIEVPQALTDFALKEITLKVSFIRIEPMVGDSHHSQALDLYRAAVRARLGVELAENFEEELDTLLSGQTGDE